MFLDTVGLTTGGCRRAVFPIAATRCVALVVVFRVENGKNDSVTETSS